MRPSQSVSSFSGPNQDADRQSLGFFPVFFEVPTAVFTSPFFPIGFSNTHPLSLFYYRSATASIPISICSSSLDQMSCYSPTLASSPTSISSLRISQSFINAPQECMMINNYSSRSRSDRFCGILTDHGARVILPGNRHDCALCSRSLLEKNVCRLLFQNIETQFLDSVCPHHFHTDCVKSPVTPRYCPLCMRQFSHIQPVEMFIPFDISSAHKWFKFLDCDEDQKLSYQEVISGLKSQSILDRTQIELDMHQLWRRFDADCDGFVGFVEFVKPIDGLFQYINSNFGRDPRLPPPDLRSNKIAWFRHWDKSRTGGLSKFDIINALLEQFQDRNVEFSDVSRHIDALWAKFDPADTGRIDIKDFVIKHGLADAIIDQLEVNGIYPIGPFK